MHSHSALVDKAYWKGAVAASACFETCFAIVRATDLRRMFPTTIALTPPSGLLNAVKRPIRMASKISPGTCPVAKRLETLGKKTRNNFTLQHRGEVVRRRARRTCCCTLARFLHTDQELLGGQLETLCNNSAHLFGGTRGRLSRWVNSLRVAIVPGAIEAPSRACLAADNSPTCTRDERVRPALRHHHCVDGASDGNLRVEGRCDRTFSDKLGTCV